MCKKRLFFNVLQFDPYNVVQFDPAFPGSFVSIEKDRDPVKCNACAVNQKIVTAWFSGNSLISKELLLRIS